MALNTTRIDKFIAEHLSISRRDVRLILAKKRVKIDDQLAMDIAQRINTFSTVTLDDVKILDNNPIYIMLNKPIGVVSATIDEKHQTVIDLLDIENKADLHIAGRLDLNTSGLMLLTNDSRWSESLSSPENKIEKCYQVTLEHPVTDDYVDAFSEGFYFAYENITTLPAKLRIINTHHAEVKLLEGKYHQIKRMFGRFQNKVIELHRSSIGHIELDDTLKPSEYRILTEEEIKLPLQNNEKEFT